MSGILMRWNHLPRQEAVNEISPCCGSRAWADTMAARRPFPDETTLLAASDETWSNLTTADWLEAFRSHPRIGESRPVQSTATGPASDQFSNWSAQEQRKVAAADDAERAALAEASREYERRFHNIFIVCAAGKSAAEILEILRRRLQNDGPTELREAAEQQRQITHIRLTKWLSA